ncbi:MAG: NAD-dependent deacetylase [Fidelibacterota bacterium]
MIRDTKLTSNTGINLVFFTGAGISAESGVPTYRGKGGIWEQYDWQAVASQEAFNRNPRTVIAFHHKRRKWLRTCKPNGAHEVIADLETKVPVTVITQNIDGLHQDAGSQNVIELHGSLWRSRCEACHTVIHSKFKQMVDNRCNCGRWLRPDITWFSDPINQQVFDSARKAVESCTHFFSVGTSGVVWPAAGIPSLALEAGVVCTDIDIDPNKEIPAGFTRLTGKASEILPELFQLSE